MKGRTNVSRGRLHYVLDLGFALTSCPNGSEPHTPSKTVPSSLRGDDKNKHTVVRKVKHDVVKINR